MVIKNKRAASILTENIIFIILNIVFLIILILFVFSKSGGAAVLEEKYAKKIALTLDSAKPFMIIKLNMQDAFGEMEKNWKPEDIVKINDNVVSVKLREKGGYSYSFFNNIQISNYYPDNNGNYYFIIEKWAE